MPRIFVVDDHAIMRQVLRDVLEREEGFTVCGEAASAEEALDEVDDAAPDLVLVDVSLPGMSGIELVETLRERHPEMPMAMLSGHGERTHVEQALRAGASGYILKGDPYELPGAIRQMMRGETYRSQAVESS